MRWTIGVDLGGTNLRAAQVHESGELGSTRHVPVDHAIDDGPPNRAGASPRPFGQLVEVLVDLVGALGGRQQIGGIGVAVTGPVSVTGWVDNPHTLPATMQGDLIGAVRSRFDVPIAVENDANAAALGEARFGAGRDGDVVVCVTVGTGIGVGVVAHGRLYEGGGRAHPEPGHLVVDPAGPACYCGASGCIESLASATAVAKAAVAEGVIAPGATTRQVHDLAAAGDPAARRLVDQAHHSLAAGIRTLVAVYAPDVVVLAGNAVGDWSRLVGLVSAAVDGFPFGAAQVSVRPAALGNWAGCIGAASLVQGLSQQ